MTAGEPDFELPPLPPLGTGARLLVAFSGGLDSMVLLHRLAALAPQRVRALHVHHGLQAAAEDWAAQCRQTAIGLGVPIEILRVAVPDADPAGPEAAARRVRHAALQACMQPGDVVVMAHHRDDQAETVLLRLLRGTGVAGLAAMPALSRYGPGWLWRPLLQWPRSLLAGWARARGLRWIDDPHNADLRYLRSWLRQAVVPLLASRQPALDAVLARTARLAAEAQAVLDERAAEDLAVIADGEALQIPRLRALPPARQRNLLRHWIGLRALPMPDADGLDRLPAEVFDAPRDADPCLRWPGAELRRHRDRLHLLPAGTGARPAIGDTCWTEGCRCPVPGSSGWLLANAPPPWPITVRAVQPGESIRPVGRRTRRLRLLFQALGVPIWLRHRLPMLDAGDDRRCIPGLVQTEAWQRAIAASDWRLQWFHDEPGLVSPQPPPPMSAAVDSP